MLHQEAADYGSKNYDDSYNGEHARLPGAKVM
jgi:hypothetical protein